MKHAWRDGTAPTRTLDVPDFVECHVHENFAVSMGPKPLPRHKHLEGTKSPLIVRNPPHHVHKSLNLYKSSMGTEGGATSNQIKIKGRRAVKKDNKLQHHPYAYAAKNAKRQGGLGLGDDVDGDTNDDMSPSPLFTKAGIIGTPEFDSYDKYRLDIFPFKEALKHEVNKLVLQKQKLDEINQQLREERRQLLEERMRGRSGCRRARHVQQEPEEDNETTTTEGDDEDDISDNEDNDDDTGTTTDTEYDTDDDNNEEEINEDEEQQ